MEYRNAVLAGTVGAGGCRRGPRCRLGPRRSHRRSHVTCSRMARNTCLADGPCISRWCRLRVDASLRVHACLRVDVSVSTPPCRRLHLPGETALSRGRAGAARGEDEPVLKPTEGRLAATVSSRRLRLEPGAARGVGHGLLRISKTPTARGGGEGQRRGAAARGAVGVLETPAGPLPPAVSAGPLVHRAYGEGRGCMRAPWEGASAKAPQARPSRGWPETLFSWMEGPAAPPAPGPT